MQARHIAALVLMLLPACSSKNRTAECLASTSVVDRRVQPGNTLWQFAMNDGVIGEEPVSAYFQVAFDSTNSRAALDSTDDVVPITMRQPRLSREVIYTLQPGRRIYVPDASRCLEQRQ